MRLLHLGISAISAASLFCLATSPAFASTVTVQPSQTFWSISQSNHVSLQSLESANPSVNPSDLSVGTVLQLPAGQTSSTYVVHSGDSLWKIAQRYNTSVTSITKANPTLSPADLIIGTTINIPSSTMNSAQTNFNQSSTNIYQQNLYWMEHAIHAEADGEPLDAQIAVGDVILHRLETGTYGSTIKDVLFQVINGHYQFTCVANGQIYTTPTASSIQAANDVLVNHDDMVPGAFVFYNPAKTASGSWVWSQPAIAKIGDFIFAK